MNVRILAGARTTLYGGVRQVIGEGRWVELLFTNGDAIRLPLSAGRVEIDHEPGDYF